MEKHGDCTALQCGCMNMEHHGHLCRIGCELQSTVENEAVIRRLGSDKRPQDPELNGAGWKYENLEHGGRLPDTMPQAIRATDADGRSCIYVPRTA